MKNIHTILTIKMRNDKQWLKYLNLLYTFELFQLIITNPRRYFSPYDLFREIFPLRYMIVLFNFIYSIFNVLISFQQFIS